MGKYDELIGGGKLILDVEEILNEESAKKVDDRIKKQKAELEKPIEINVKSNKAENQLKALHKAAQKVKDDLQDAISSQKGFEEVNKLVTKYGHLKKQIGDIAPVVGKNNATLKESNKILKDTKKLVDQLTVSQDKLNKTKTTRKKTAPAKVDVIGTSSDKDTGVTPYQDQADQVKKLTKEVETAGKAQVDVAKTTVKSLDELEKKYFSIIGTVEKYFELMSGFKNLYGTTARDLRKQIINFAKAMPEDVANMIGEGFTNGLKNAFKGVSTKDIVNLIETPFRGNVFGALEHKLDLAKAIDFDKITYTVEGAIKLSDSDNPFEFLDSVKGQLPIMNELYETLDSIAKVKKEIGKSNVAVQQVEMPELLQHVEVLESRDEIYDAKTVAQKRKAAAEMVRDEYAYYQQLEEALASPEHTTKDGTVFDIEDIDLQKQKVRIEATIALYEKFGGVVDKLGKKIKAFADNWGMIGNYQFVLDNYQATLIQEATEAIEQQTAATEKLAEARLKLTPKKEGSYTVPETYVSEDGKFEVSKGKSGWDVYQRDNAGMYNLIATYKHLDDVRKDSSLLAREEIIFNDEIVEGLHTLQEAYRTLGHQVQGRRPVIDTYLDLLIQIKSGALSAADAMEQFNSTVGSAQPKQQDASSNDLVAKTNILAEFTQLSGQLAFQHVGTEQYDAIVGKIEEISNGILNTGMSLEDANKQLNEFIDGLTQAVQPSNKLTSSYEGLVEAIEKFADINKRYLSYSEDYRTLEGARLAAQNKVADFVPDATNAHAEVGKDLSYRLAKRMRQDAQVGAVENILKLVENRIKQGYTELEKMDTSVKYTVDYPEGKIVHGRTSYGTAYTAEGAYNLMQGANYEPYAGTFGARLSVITDKEIDDAKELDDITKQYNARRQKTQDILNKEKLTFEELVYLVKEYSQSYWNKLSNPHLIADSINLEIDLREKLGWRNTLLPDMFKSDGLFDQLRTSDDSEYEDKVRDIATIIANGFGVALPQTVDETTANIEQQAASVANIVKLVDNYGTELDEVNNKLMQGTTLLNEQAQVLRLFHNSSEVFDQFDITKAGSNQGQALGIGNYLALRQDGEFNDLTYGRYQTQWYANVQNAFNVRDRLTDTQSAAVIDKFMADRAEGFKQHMLSKLLDGDIVTAIKDIAEISKTNVGEIFGYLGYDAIIDGAQVNVFDPSKIHRVNDSVLDIGTGEFDAFRELQKNIWAEHKVIENANKQIEKLSNQYSGKTKEELDSALFAETLIRAWNWRDNVAKIASALKELTGELPTVDGISEESMRAMVENYEFSKQDLQGYIDEKANHVKILNQLETQFFAQEQKIHDITQSYLTGNISGIVNQEVQPQIAQQTTLQIEAQADAEQKVAEATQEQIKSAKERLAIERQVTAELEKHQDIAQQIMIADSDDLSYESPYSAEQIANFTNGTDINKILTRFGVPTDKKEPIIDQFNQWVSLIAEQRELESQGIESLEYDFSTMIDQAMSQLVDMIMKDGTTRQPIEKTLETFYEFIQDYKIKYSASDVSEFGSQWPAILRQFGTGKYGVLTQDKSAKSINDKWSELLEVFPQLFDSETINEKDQLIQFLDVVKAARAEHNNKSKTQPVDLPDYAKNNVMYDLSSTYGIISGNIEAMVSGLDRATSEQEKLSSVATITEQHLEGQSDAAKRFANTLSDIIDNEGVSKEIEKLFEPDVKNMIDNIRSAAQKGKVEFLQNILDSEELTTALTGAFSDAYNNIGDYKFRGKYPFEHDGLNKATIHLISKDESKTLDYVLKLEDGLLKIDKAKQKIGTTKFNIEHEVNSANAEVDKLVAKLNGRQLDGLDNLRTLANNIVDTESLAKFTDELDVISKKVATLSSKASSSKGFNPLTNSVYEMENASITVETYAKQLERLGDADGVSKAAEQLDNMASAAERFKNATNQTEEEGAFADYQQAKSKYKAYYEYAQESKKSAEAEAKQVNTEEQKIQQYYQSILNTVNKINALDKEIEQAKGKNQTGAFSEFINKTQEEKAKLISDVKATLSEVAGLFGNGMIGQDVSVGGAKFFSSEDTNNLNAFLQSAQVQTALAQGDVNKLSECLGQLSSAFANSEKIGAQASETIRSSLQKASEVGQKIFRFDELGNIAGSNGFNENIQLYDDALKSYQTLQLVMAQLSGKSETDWTAEEAAAVKLLSEEFVKLGTQIDAVKQKEDRFFSDKPVYSLDGLPSADLTSLGIDDVKKLGEVGSSTKEKLEGMAQAIAKNSNGAVVLTKSFTQGADGISKLDFSVFDQNTNSIRDFTAAMGAATNQFTVYETTIDKSVANIASARKQLNTAGDMLKTLGASGVDISADGAPAKVAQLISLMNQLEKAIEVGDQTMITKLTKDVKLAAGETDKLYKQMLQLDDAIASDKVRDLGKGDASGNVYNQLVDATKNLVGTNQNATVEFGRFDAATNTLNASLVNANGTVENFKVSMNGLNGQMTAQQTGVSKLTSTWDTFKASISKAGKQLMTAFVGYNVFYKAISEVRKGVGYVKEIDLALTELKKVTDETEESYRQFLNTAASTAGKIGSTVSDFTEATSNFARLGYTMEESANMAETAIVYRNVADGLDTVEEATDSIISTMKAFGIESNNTMGIVDRFNEVGNNFAITSAGIGEALQRSASALYAGGNTIDESIALVTASNSVIQNPEQVGG